MPVPARRLEPGTIWVDVAAPGSAGRTVSCVRVWSGDRRTYLGRRVARLTSWAAASGRAVAGVVSEAGAGLGGRRPKLRRVLADRGVSVVVVERRDRLGRCARLCGRRGAGSRAVRAVTAAGHAPGAAG